MAADDGWKSAKYNGMHLSEIKQRYHEQVEAGETPNPIPYTKASITKAKQQSSQAPSEESESEEEAPPKEEVPPKEVDAPKKRGVRRKESPESPKDGPEASKRPKKDSSDEEKGFLDTTTSSSSKSTSPSSSSDNGEAPQMDLGITGPLALPGPLPELAPTTDSSALHMDEDHSGTETNSIVASFLNFGAAMDHLAEHSGECSHEDLHS